MSVEEREIEDEDEDGSDDEDAIQKLIGWSDGVRRDLTRNESDGDKEDENPADVSGEGEVTQIEERVKEEGGAVNGAEKARPQDRDKDHSETCDGDDGDDDKEGEVRRGVKREQDDAEKGSEEEEESDSEEEEGESCECVEVRGCSSTKRASRSITCNICLLVFKDGRHYSTHGHRWPCSKLTVPGGPEALRWLHEIFEGRLAVFMLRNLIHLVCRAVDIEGVYQAWR